MTPLEKADLVETLTRIATAARLIMCEPKGSRRSASLYEEIVQLLGFIALDNELDLVLLADEITRRWESVRHG